MKEAFDSPVILKAMSYRPGLKVVDEHTAEVERCWAAVERASSLIVCPIVWLEISRFARPDEIDKIGTLQQRVRIEPIDEDVITKCHALMRKRVQVWDKTTCAKCRNPPSQEACQGCGRMMSEKARFNDYLIVAHADSLGVDRLYSTDNGMIAMERDVSIKIMNPPGIHGPLFDIPPPAADTARAKAK